MTITRALLWIGLIVVTFVVALLAYATTRPKTFRVSRSAIINAPADRIYPLIDDFRAWSTWSPFDQLDPAMKKTFSGPATGTGSVYEWSGNRRAGAGRMENMGAQAPSRVVIELDFLRPIEGHDIAEFKLVPEGGSTRVTWSIDGPSPFVSRVVGVFLDMDKLIGNDFETGLANLKAVAEK